LHDAATRTYMQGLPATLFDDTSSENRSFFVKPDRSSHEVATGPLQHFKTDNGTHALKCRIQLRYSRFEYAPHGVDASTEAFSSVAYIFR
jgi:hypothetical protein